MSKITKTFEASVRSIIQDFLSQISFLSSLKHRNEALRIIPVNEAGAASTITTVTGVTTVSTITNFGTNVATNLPAKLLVDAQMNALATFANINNVIPA